MLMQQILSVMQKVTFVGYSTTYSTVGTQTVSIPVGATTVTVECFGGGEAGSTNFKSFGVGGGGGAYSKRNSYSTAGLSGIYIDVPAGGSLGGADGADAVARENSVAGTIVCLAKGGGTAGGGVGGASASGTGDVKHSGGNGAGAISSSGGGGGAGPSGNGSNGSGATGGASGGSPAGAGGNGTNNAGNEAGGGGGAGSSSFAAGAKGRVILTWA